jgi:hypothetical protein
MSSMATPSIRLRYTLLHPHLNDNDKKGLLTRAWVGLAVALGVEMDKHLQGG